MKDEIPQFLKDQFKKKMPKIRFFPNDIKQFMLDYNNFYKLYIPEDNMKLIYKLIKSGVTIREKCQLDGCNELQGFDVVDRMTIGCCRSHSQKITNLERYGTDNYSKTTEFHRKRKTTCFKKFGVEHQMMSDKIKNKTKNTCIEKYGVEHHMFDPIIKERSKNKMLETIDEAKEKRKTTMLKKFGETTNLKCEETKEKIKKTNLEKYGDENTFGKNSILRKKFENERFEKYGVYHNMQIPEICEKQQNNRYKHKIHTWETGETTSVQGYEHLVLADLEKNGYFFNDVLTKKSDMPEIWYEFEGKKRRYFPDIYIPKENLIIEVKSEYTVNKNIEINKLKFTAVEKTGYNFKLEVR